MGGDAETLMRVGNHTATCGTRMRLLSPLKKLPCLLESVFIVGKRESVLNRYVEYESKLEELRRLRKEKLRLEGKASIADRALMRRIHFIFERATRKFPGDLRLWLAWLEFCQAQSSKRIFSRVQSPSHWLMSRMCELHGVRCLPSEAHSVSVAIMFPISLMLFFWEQ